MGMIMEKNAYGISVTELDKMKNIDIRNVDPDELEDAYSARTAHPFRRNGAPFRLKLSKAQLVD